MRVRMRMRMGEGESGCGSGCRICRDFEKFPQTTVLFPSHFPKTSLGIKIFSPTALAQTGTFCTSGVGVGEGAGW